MLGLAAVLGEDGLGVGMGVKNHALYLRGLKGMHSKSPSYKPFL